MSRAFLVGTRRGLRGLWLLLCLQGIFAQPLAARELLLVSSYHPEFPWTAACEQGIAEELTSDYHLQTIYLDSKRLPYEEVVIQAEHAWKQIQARAPDLVLLGDDNALKLLGPNLAGTSLPVVYYGINNNPRHYFEQGLPGNITGILERMSLLPSFRYIGMLMDEPKKALVLLDRSQTSDSVLQLDFKHDASAYIAGIETEYRVIEFWSDWQYAIKEAGRYDFVLLATFFALKDGHGNTLSTDQLVRRSSVLSPVPLFSSQSSAVHDEGVVGALVVDPVHHGRQAAQRVRLILEQKVNPHEMQPAMDRAGHFYLNRAQLERYELSVPESLRSAVIYR